MPEVSFPVFGPAKLVVSWDSSKANDWLQGLLDRGKNPAPFWAEVGTILRNRYRENFARGGAPPWIPLRASTIRQKAKFLSGKPSPPFTKKGKVPLRLRQNGSFGAATILVRTGKLRDSWVQKSATGHVEEVSADGQSFFVGSQLTVAQDLPVTKPQKKYHLLSKKAKAQRAQGQSVTARVPLARFHEEGTTKMPPRPVAVLWGEDYEALEAAAQKWLLGDP